jgi:hypothetical protein
MIGAWIPLLSAVIPRVKGIPLYGSRTVSAAGHGA